ncbi:MAG: hypothetical protein SFW09_21645 [Hyphomicrobiaceae bacterium]|nr:hypothetical protein [Hyphomicrobiaceae bacterium]
MLKRVVRLLIAFPAALLLITLAVSNRHGVRLVLDPFRPEAPALAVEMPFYFFLFGALVAGVVLGGWATWLGQSQWRRMARSRAQDAMKWRAEADRLARERDDSLEAGGGAGARALAVVRR